MQPAQTAERLARISRLLGILSVIIPLLSFFILMIPQDGTKFLSLLVSLTTLGGALFGVPGYMAATTARRDYGIIRDDRIMAIVMTGRMLSVIGIVISLLFISNRICATGIAY